MVLENDVEEATSSLRLKDISVVRFALVDGGSDLGLQIVSDEWDSFVYWSGNTLSSADDDINSENLVHTKFDIVHTLLDGRLVDNRDVVINQSLLVLM